jgi:hypothetical protein
MKILKRVAIGSLGGVLVAAAFLLIGLIRAVIAFIGGRHVSLDDLWPTIAWYAGAFAIAGIVGGLLWDLSRYRLGRWALTILGAACVVGVLFVQSDGAPWGWGYDTVVGFTGLSLVFGLAAGLGIDREYRKGGS